MKTSQRRLYHDVWRLMLVVPLIAGCGRMTEQGPAADGEAPAEVAVAEGASDGRDAVAKLADAQAIMECYATYQEAVQSNDEAGKLDCFTTRDRNRWVGWYAYYLDREVFFDKPNAEPAKALLAKHGVDAGRVMMYVNRSSNSDLQPLESLLTRIGEKVLDTPQFVTDAAKLVDVKSESNLIGSATAKLAIVQQDADSAKGHVTDPSSGQVELILFQKEADRWLIQIDTLQTKRRVMKDAG